MEGVRPSSKDDVVLHAFRSSLLSMAECSAKAVPALGSGLQGRLKQAADALSESNPAKTSDRVRNELAEWAEKAVRHHIDAERDIRAIIETLGKTAESIGDRGSEYVREIGDVNAGLRLVAGMKDPALIRQGLLKNIHALNSCVERMVEDNQQSVAVLTAQVKEYRNRLAVSERNSMEDPLTGLANRRAFEQQLRLRIAAREPFCLMMLDLNGFKQVNDTHGHLAGDELLKQFGAALRQQFTSSDLVARWGGDEFALLVRGAMPEATRHAGRLQRFVLREYKLVAIARPVRVQVTAALGVVEWESDESESSLLARADQEVYRAKASR